MNRVVVLSGPSAVGKSTVVRCLRERVPDLHFSVSATTRAPRPGEVDGVDYTFVSADEFQRLIDDGELLEWAEIHGGLQRSGTPARPVREAIAAGRPVLIEVDLAGARAVKEAMPEVLTVFLAPPSWEALESRLIGRGTESAEVQARRLADDLGAKLDLVQTSMPDIMNGLSSGRYDLIISGYSITPERALRINFSNPYYYTHIRLVASKQAAPGKTSAYFNSPNITLGVVAGHSEIQVAEKCFPLASLRLFDTEEALLDALLAGKVPAAVVSDQLIRFNVAFHANKLYLPDDKSLSAAPVAIAVRKGNQELLNFLNSWIAILHGEGWIEARRAFWYEQSSWIKDVPGI